jgi:hypothetical protein
MITRSFLAGVACLAAFLLLPHPWKVLYPLGWFGLLFAYFLWLKQTHEKKTPLITRGGLLKFDQQPRLYKWVLLILVAIGIFVAFIALIISFNL